MFFKRRKPVSTQILAHKTTPLDVHVFDGTLENTYNIMKWLGHGYIDYNQNQKIYFRINTVDGFIKVSEGDAIVKGSDREIYLIKSNLLLDIGNWQDLTKSGQVQCRNLQNMQKTIR